MLNFSYLNKVEQRENLKNAGTSAPLITIQLVVREYLVHSVDVPLAYVLDVPASHLPGPVGC